MSSSRELAAIHEAGHAAAIRELKELVSVVMIGAHGDGATGNRHSLWFGTTIRRADELRICIAGPLAESWYCRDSVEDILLSQTGFDGTGDGDRVLAVLNGDTVQQWVRKTERTIRGGTRGIERLAQRLLVDGSVDGKTATAILRG